MKLITQILPALLSLVILSGLTGCSSLPLIGESNSIVDDGPVAFIDLDVFDSRLTQNMRGMSPLVTVVFPHQPVKVNNLPERLQRWLSAVHTHGGGIVVETKDGYVQKDLMSLIGMLMSGYELAKRSIPALIGRQFKAVIVLDSADGVVDTVDFIRL